MSTEKKFGHVKLTERPHAADLTKTFRIVRTPSEKTLQLDCLSVTNVGCYTHYYRKSTRPHTESMCEPCDNQCRIEWHGYLAVRSTKTFEIAIFEFTAPCCNQLDEYLRIHKTLRGSRIEASRLGRRINSRVMLRLTPGPFTEIELPQAPCVASFLERLWCLPHMALTRPTTQKDFVEEKFVTPTTQLIETVATQRNGHKAMNRVK